MGSFWRSFSKGIFWASFILCLLACLIWGLVVGEMPLSLIIILGGAFVVTMMHSFLGTLLEFFDNVALIKRKLYNESGDDSIKLFAGKKSGGDSDKPGEDINVWKCPVCGHPNIPKANFCGQCAYPHNKEQ